MPIWIAYRKRTVAHQVMRPVYFLQICFYQNSAIPNPFTTVRKSKHVLDKRLHFVAQSPVCDSDTHLYKQVMRF
ncbi:MAG: hypothetical protein A2X74_06460 [Polynucleobacter sp. GWA2_45_21]|nr:MAG: hypothetical protein A2X74_06460 [Polynucleobacter sp. GWA2_45_21]